MGRARSRAHGRLPISLRQIGKKSLIHALSLSLSLTLSAPSINASTDASGAYRMSKWAEEASAPAPPAPLPPSIIKLPIRAWAAGRREEGGLVEAVNTVAPASFSGRSSMAARPTSGASSRTASPAGVTRRKVSVRPAACVLPGSAAKRVVAAAASALGWWKKTTASRDPDRRATTAFQADVKDRSAVAVGTSNVSVSYVKQMKYMGEEKRCGAR